MPLSQTLLFQALLILAVTAAFSWGFRYLCRRLRDSKGGSEWLRILGKSLYTPSLFLIWGYGLLSLLQLLLETHGPSFSEELIEEGQRVFFVIGITWLALIWKRELVEHFVRRAKKQATKGFDIPLIHAVEKLVSVSLVILSGLIILQIFNVPIAGLLAFGGVGGIAISLASGDMIKNFFGGLMIYINRPFAIDDWIKSPNKNFEGVVEHIGWYMTRIRTFERRPTYIPNALITDAIVENPSRMYNRRIRLTFGLRYRDIDLVEAVVSDIRELMSRHEAIDQKQTLLVHFVEYGTYSLNLEVYSFTKTTIWQHWRDIQQDVLLQIAGIVRKHGAEFAFPTNTVHLK